MRRVVLALLPLAMLASGSCAPSAPLPPPTLPARAARDEPSTVTFAAGFDDLLLLRGDGTVARWTNDLRPAAAPRTNRIVGFSRGVRHLGTVAEDRFFHGVLPGRCSTFAAPPVRVRQAQWDRSFVVLDADGVVWFAEPPPRARDWRCTQERAEAVALEYRRLAGFDRTRQLVRADPSPCAILEGGEVRCVDPRTEPPSTWTFPMDGPARDAVAPDSSALCGVDLGGTLRCAEPFTDRLWTYPGSERFVAVAAWHAGVCALESSGHVRCSRPEFTADADPRRRGIDFGDARLPPSSRFVVVDSFRRTSACVATDDDEVVCIHRSDESTNLPADGAVRLPRLDELRRGVLAMDSSEAMSCALEVSRGLRCWLHPESEAMDADAYDGRPSVGGSSPLTVRGVEAPGDVRDLVVVERTLCVVLADDSLRCGLVPVEQSTPVAWERIAERLHSMDAGPEVLCFVAGDAAELRCRGRLVRDDGSELRAFDPAQSLTLGGASTGFRSVAVGERHLCAIVQDGSVACLGEGTEGQLGLGGSRLIARELQLVDGVDDARIVIADSQFTCAQTRAGATFCWGDGAAFHPVRNETLEGGELFPISPHHGYSIPCRIGTELVCAFGAGRTLLAPWESRPLPELDAAGDLHGYVLSVGPVNALCEYETPASSDDVTTCYVDAPIPATSPLNPEALNFTRIPPTPEDLPTFPVERPTSARMYAFEAESGVDLDCSDTHVLNADRTTCGQLRHRGRALRRDEMVSVLESVNDVANYPTGVVVGCFNPHHAIVFFDSRGRPLGRLDICFECGSMSGEPGLAAQRAARTNFQPNRNEFAAICRRLGMPGCDPQP